MGLGFFISCRETSKINLSTNCTEKKINTDKEKVLINGSFEKVSNELKSLVKPHVAHSKPVKVL